MQPTYYTIYKTTNLVNSKVYIGKHVTQNLDDGYLGSGKLLRRAVNKYGVENFRKDILHVFDNEADMNDREREIVTEEFVLQETNYNLCVGGKGGFSYINTKLSKQMKRVRKNNLATIPKEVLRENGRRNRRNNPFTREQNIANAAKAWTDEARDRRMKTRAERNFQQGENNSQFGSRWITNGEANRKIRKTDSIPDGWRAGRV